MRKRRRFFAFRNISAPDRRGLLRRGFRHSAQDNILTRFQNRALIRAVFNNLLSDIFCKTGFAHSDQCITHIFYAKVENPRSFPQFPQGFPQEMLEKQGFLPTYPQFCAFSRCGLGFLSTDQRLISLQKTCIRSVFVTLRRFGLSHLCQY